MTNTITATQTPANAVTEDQAVRMLEGQGVYSDRIGAAFYRLRTRTTTLIQGATTYRVCRIADDVYVVTLEA